eukprot:CAMPEP_0115444280 /NCGR_PEP_ID=MMETSP0271-20121206/38313_1 /TAXON_ID=71861 /ORGANISM="Scrippsiella trochoidea, Strain CCMP3099" /LENGTH=78 /DNA_ID=CAMNT_0002870203 /DNA_START=60 /DNA_END=293 /DNA_ORIENTATION=+
MAAPRSLVLTGAVLSAGAMLLASLSSAFVAAPQRAPAPATSAAHSAGALPAAALSAVTLVTPAAAHAEGGSVWIPALS